MNDKYDNYSINTNNLKYTKNYNGEYLRDCLFEDTCIGANTIVDGKKSSMFNVVSTSVLQKMYSYDNVRTRGKLLVPKLVKNKTDFDVLKPEKKINIVGFLLIPPRLSYSNFNMKLNNSLFSLEEVRYYHYLNYTFDLFKNIFHNEDVISKIIDIDTRKVEDYTNDLYSYMFHDNVIDINNETLGNIMKENLPSHSDILNSIVPELFNSIKNISQLEKLLFTYEIKFEDLDNITKTELIKKIEENIKKLITK